MKLARKGVMIEAGANEAVLAEAVAGAAAEAAAAGAVAEAIAEAAAEAAIKQSRAMRGSAN